MALNDVAIRALKPQIRSYMVADEKGFCIEVAVSGSKLWRFATAPTQPPAAPRHKPPPISFVRLASAGTQLKSLQLAVLLTVSKPAK